jgi:hypothetical protein
MRERVASGKSAYQLKVVRCCGMVDSNSRDNSRSTTVTAREREVLHRSKGSSEVQEIQTPTQRIPAAVRQ